METYIKSIYKNGNKVEKLCKDFEINKVYKGGKVVFQQVVVDETIKPVTYSTYTASAAQAISFNSGSYLYSYDNNHWSAATGPISFGTTGRETVYVAGENTHCRNASFSTSASVAIGGCVNGLCDCYNPDTSVLPISFINMYLQCSAVTSVTETYLPSTDLNGIEKCYAGMFAETNIVKAPAFPAEVIPASGYCNTFLRCTAMTQASEIGATTLSKGCCQGMYAYTSLRKSPTLKAKILVTNCYRYMFQGCSSLNKIHCLAEDISATYCTREWVLGVGSTGIFISYEGTKWPIGINGIPSGWNRIDE